ncbi:VTT domain-containing protein [Candidatus Bathyarchaeota archaeon]|nr:VTT domain-containing protein [Candidatus Bathyarchaeota archaeon]
MNKKNSIIFIGLIIISLVSGLILWNVLFFQTDLEKYGLFGIFIVTLLSHATMVARDVFIPLFLVLSSNFNPLLLGTVAGIGGALGDLIPYLLGISVAEIITENTKTTDYIAKWINKFGLWAILAVSMTPLPDTPIIMLAGTRRLPFYKLFFIEAFGKTILYSIGAVFGSYIFNFFNDILGNVLTQLVITFFSLILCVFLTWPPSRDYFFELIEKIFFKKI